MASPRPSFKIPVGKRLRHYWLALRPHQWTKNLIVFAAPLFDFHPSWRSALGSMLAFGLFCAVSSSFYLLNDLIDIQSDRQHPVKCKRPIAAGLVSIPVACCMAIVGLVGGLTVGWLWSPYLGVTLGCYALLQVAYNVKLKRTVILDVLAIAAGFVLRAYAGAAATRVTLSPWFILCTAMLALFLGIEKRKAELRLAELNGVKTRAVLNRYSISLLSRMENTVTAGVVVTYALWSSGPQVQGATTPWMLVTLPFVLYGIFRYQLLSDPHDLLPKHHADSAQPEPTERPEDVLLKDTPMLLTVIGWVSTVFTILLLEQQGILK
jgi:4-hydroxybenzoate polyprenyltransferase